MEGGVTGVHVDASLACAEASYWLSGRSVGAPPSYRGEAEEAAVTGCGRAV